MKGKEKKKRKFFKYLSNLVEQFTRAYSREIRGGEGGEESIGRESNYVLLKLNVIDIMHSYFRVIRAVFSHHLIRLGTRLLLLLLFVKNHRQRRGTSISIQIDICSNQTASPVSSFPLFFSPSSLSSFFLPLVESVLIPNAAVVKVTRKWRDDNDGSMAILV